jgi:hypothetical protein
MRPNPENILDQATRVAEAASQYPQDRTCPISVVADALNLLDSICDHAAMDRIDDAIRAALVSAGWSDAAATAFVEMVAGGGNLLPSEIREAVDRLASARARLGDAAAPEH